jgi:pentatricopeptide repeat protein
MRESPYLILCKALTLSRLISGSDVLEKELVNEKFRLLSPKSYGRYYPFEGLLEDLIKQQIIKIDILKGDKLKVFEDSSLELPAIKHLKFNVYYKNIKELKGYIKPYQELLTEFVNNEEKLKNYINSLIIDLINYSLLPEDYESVIMEGFLKLKKSDSNYDDALELVNDKLNHMIMSKKITFDEHEKIYIPYYPEYNQNNTIYLLNREIDKLNKFVKETEKENNILKSKIEDIEDDKELYRKLIHSINIIQMKDRDLHPAIEELTYLSQIHKYRKAASLYLGKAYMKIGEYEKAIEIYDKMVNHGLKNTYIYNVLGTANVKIGNYTAAMENFQNSLMLISDQPRILHYVNELSRYFSDNNMVSTN